MKKKYDFYNSMKLKIQFISFISLILFSNNFLFANGGIGYKGIKLNLNGTNTWYNVHGVTWGYQGCGDYGSTFYNSGNENWNNTNLGTFNQNETLQIIGFAVVGWANGVDYIAGKLQYKIWKQGDAEPVTWIEIEVGNYNNPTSGPSQVVCNPNDDRIVGFNDGNISFQPNAPGIYNFKVKALGRGQYTGNNGGGFNDNDGPELTATFTIRPTVTFNANGGSGTMGNQMVAFNSPTALNNNTFTRVSYAFNGWNTASDGSGTSYADGANVTLTANTTLYAQWLATPPIINVGTLSPFPNTCVNSTSDIQSYTVSGSNLTDNITLTAPTGYEISFFSDADFGTTKTLIPVDGEVVATTIYVRFTPTSATTFSGNITHESTGATTANVAVSGDGALLSFNTQPSNTDETSNTGIFQALTVAATGAGTLTYQWFINTENNNTGGSAISGATNTSYTPEALIGDYYYYASVSDDNCSGQIKSEVSGKHTYIKNETSLGLGTTTPGNILFAIRDTGTGLDNPLNNHLALKSNNISRLQIDGDGHVGINNPHPSAKLDINAKNEPIRISNLDTSIASSVSFLALDAQGNLKKRTFSPEAGKIIRMGFNTSTNIPAPNGKWPLRFNDHDTTAEMGNSPATIPNFVNNIPSATFDNNVSATAGNGVNARTTDQINLPAGVYRLTLRLSGKFNTSDAQNHLDLQIVVNNHEYSYISGLITGTGTLYKSNSISETVVLNNASTLDFNFIRTSGSGDLTLAPKSSGNSYSNLIIIEKIQ